MFRIEKPLHKCQMRPDSFKDLDLDLFTFDIFPPMN